MIKFVKFVLVGSKKYKWTFNFLYFHIFPIAKYD